LENLEKVYDKHEIILELLTNCNWNEISECLCRLSEITQVLHISETPVNEIKLFQERNFGILAN
jgi:hypothetical protein